MNVLELIAKRRAAFANKRASVRDGFHLALVVEGGGMRAVYAAGMAEGLQAMGLTPLFDSVHGSSAGALIGAYSAAGQAEVSADIFCQDAASPRFIDYKRVFALKPIMDLPWLIFDVFKDAKPLLAKRLLKGAHPPLYIVATDARTGRPVTFSTFDDEPALYRALLATAFLPIVAGASCPVFGRPLIDGGIAERVAFRSAVNAGASHVLVLLTQNWVEKPPKASLKNLLERGALCVAYGRALASAYSRRNDLMAELCRVVGANGEGLFEGTHFQFIFPGVVAKGPSRLTTVVSVLQRARRIGRETAIRFFSN